MTMTGMFKGMNEAEVIEKGSFLPPGEYVLEIGECIVKNCTNAGLAYIAEMVIVQSSVPEFPPGKKVTYFQKLTGEAWLPGKGCLKAFICAAIGVDRKKSDPNYLASTVDPQIERLTEESINTDPNAKWPDGTPKRVKMLKGRVIRDTVSTTWTKAKTNAAGVVTKPSQEISVHNFYFTAT